MVGFAELKESESSSSSSSGSSGSSAAVAEGRSVACDRIFLNAAKLALGPPTLLKDNSKVLRRSYYALCMYMYVCMYVCMYVQYVCMYVYLYVLKGPITY